ncbi:hypothetical protein PO124_01485 [Bacillus licheniformis]|nr:hypothetical protein [Bacillus licheniformis]
MLVCTEREVIEAPKCLIGISTSPLSADGEFDAIVHPKCWPETRSNTFLKLEVCYIIILLKTFI